MTEPTKALAEIKIEGNFPVNIRDMEDMKFLGSMLAQSGYFKDTGEVAQAVVKVIAGAEIGIGPVAAMTNIIIVKGKPSFSSNLIAAQIKRHPGYDYKVLEITEKTCRIEFIEVIEIEEVGATGKSTLGEYEFNWEHAEKAKLAGKDNWKNYPRAMLFARCISAGARTYCPDVFYSHVVYTPEELDPDIQIDSDGEVLSGQFKDVTHDVIVEKDEVSTKTQPEPTTEDDLPDTVEPTIPIIADVIKEASAEDAPEEPIEAIVPEPEEEAEPAFPPGRPWMDTELSVPDARIVLYGIACVEWGYEDEADVRQTIKDANKWTAIENHEALDQIANYLMAEAPSYTPPKDG